MCGRSPPANSASLAPETQVDLLMLSIRGRIPSQPSRRFSETAPAVGTVDYPQEAERYRFCTEALVRGEGLPDQNTVKDALREMGDDSLRLRVQTAAAWCRLGKPDIGEELFDETEFAPEEEKEEEEQPAARYAGMARELQQASGGTVVPMAVDFTRGQILRAVVQSKTPIERVREDGGPVGYVIIGVGLFGLLMCLWKGFVLFTTGAKISRQMKREQANKSNPLGRVLAVYADNPETDIETLELKLDEAILRESAPIETGLSFIKVLYVVAPLLGLLGTVVGMIATFQMITLFGTGDPRMMAGGISTALVTTVLGLVVAIPLTLLHSFLQGKAKALIQVLEEQAAGIIARLAEERA